MNKKNKKIVTITCHNVYNHGASLQEYALLRFLEKQGFDVETINYTPWYLNTHFNFFSIDNPRYKKNVILKVIYIILKFPLKLLNYPRKINFDKFSRKHIKQTKQNYKTNQDLKKNLPEADAYICGSDQIWNSYFENGKDPAFYLDFVPDNKLKISYAPSFAIDEIAPDLREFVKKKISKLDAISIRESSGKQILNKLGIENTVQVLDPVFLLDKDEWDKLATPIKENNYILIYDFENNPLIKQIALEIKDKYGLSIISLNKKTNYADKKYFYKGPDMFLSLIKNADFVLANSFHALAFSIIYKKEFYIFNRKDKINTRMRDLLKLINLEKRLIDNFDAYQSSPKIDFDKIEEKISKHIQKSKNYLINSLLENNHV
jgi:hypothetical protein